MSDSEKITFPTISVAEIHDKARGDFLSKALAILQSLWFIVQCIARSKQGLALTELELVTLALASLTWVMYFFWWDKPLGVKEPIKLYRKGYEPAEKFIRGRANEFTRRRERIRMSSQQSLVDTLIVCPFRQLRSSLSQLLNNLWKTLISSIYHFLSSISLSKINTFINDQRDNLDFPDYTYLWFLYLLIYWFILLPLIALAEALTAIAWTKSFDSGKSYVPTFYAPDLSFINTLILFLLALPPIAIVFGALHCIAWNFHFPSHVEELLWRIASLAITFIPSVPFVGAFVIFLVLYLKDYMLSISTPEWLEDTLAFIAAFLSGAGLVTYMLARFLLLIQAIVLLRNQPESAFYALDWANFLPHI